MQKKLLALAIAGAMAAPLAAQAQGSNVTIYGSLKPSIDFIDDGDDSGASVRDNNSLIGFRGSEDLGNGLKAIFQIESRLEFDERTGELANRDSWVGLEGSFGSFVIGNMFPAYKRSTDFADPFADSIGDYNNIVSAQGFDGDEFNSRFRNAVHYTSPKWGGFSFQATYGLRDPSDDDQFEDDSGDADDDSFSLAGTFAWGPVTLTAAFEDQSNNSGEDAKAWKLGVGYTFGSTTLAGLWANENFGDQGADGDHERDVIFVSIKHSIGKIDLMASYTWADDFDDTDDSGADAFALGVAYNFSKRTSIAAYYVDVNNDDNANYGLDSGYEGRDDGAASAGRDLSGFSVRLRHNF